MLRRQPSHSFGLGIRLPDARQVVAAQKLRQDLGVDLVRLDLRLGDRLGPERIPDDEAGDVRPQDGDDRPRIRRGLERNMIGRLENLRREGFQARPHARDLPARQLLPRGVEHAVLDEPLMDVQADVTCHSQTSFRMV